MPAKPTLGGRLREVRTRKDLSLREVERRSGVNSGYLSLLERGEIANPNPTVLQKVAKAYEQPFPLLMQWAGYVEDGISLNAQRALSVLGDDFTDEELEALKAVLDVIRSRGGAAFALVHRTDLALQPDDLSLIRKHALAVLRESDNLGDAPVDFESVMTVAELVKVGAIELTLEEKRKLRRFFGDLVDWAVSQLRGVVHLDAGEVFINPDLHEMRKRFVLGHEAGHAVLPDHRLVFAHLDDDKRLTPEFNDLLERQANQFSIELLAKGDRLREEFDDSAPSAYSLQRLHAKYQLSLQAAARRIAEESKQSIAVALAHKAWSGEGQLMPARLYCSAGFEAQLRWAASAPPDAVQDAASLTRAGAALHPLTTLDATGRPIVLNAEGLDTRYATIVLFWPQPRPNVLSRVNPFVRTR
jgi:Zn-dependent peptidase ImmA (M78 family)/transcriptional regulator with XRE-family HTH domain